MPLEHHRIQANVMFMDNLSKRLRLCSRQNASRKSHTERDARAHELAEELVRNLNRNILAARWRGDSRQFLTDAKNGQG